MDIHDLSDDTSLSLLKVISQERELPDFVKSAHIEDLQSSDKKVFADMINHKFPLDTPADIWLSNAYLNKTASHLDHNYVSSVRNKINETAEFWGVSLEDTSTKTASIDFSGYAVVTESGPLYPLHTERLVKLANGFFPENLDGDLAVYRTKVARMIASKLDSSQWSEQVQNYLPIPRSEVIHDLDKRANLLGKSEYIDLLKAASCEVVDDQSAFEFITALSDIDKKANIEQYYGDSINNPLIYSRLIHDDITPKTLIKIGSETLPYERVLNKQANLEGLLDLPQDPYAFEYFYKTASESHQDIIEKIVL